MGPTLVSHQSAGTSACGWAPGVRRFKRDRRFELTCAALGHAGARHGASARPSRRARLDAVPMKARAQGPALSPTPPPSRCDAPVAWAPPGRMQCSLRPWSSRAQALQPTNRAGTENFEARVRTSQMRMTHAPSQCSPTHVVGPSGALRNFKWWAK